MYVLQILVQRMSSKCQSNNDHRDKSSPSNAENSIQINYTEEAYRLFPITGPKQLLAVQMMQSTSGAACRWRMRPPGKPNSANQTIAKVALQLASVPTEKLQIAKERLQVPSSLLRHAGCHLCTPLCNASGACSLQSSQRRSVG